MGERMTGDQHGVGMRGRRFDGGNDFLDALAALVAIRAEVEPTWRCSEDGAGLAVLDTALSCGLALGHESRLAVPVIGRRIRGGTVGEYCQDLDSGPGLDRMSHRRTQ